jgi:hypothetical protein
VARLFGCPAWTTSNLRRCDLSRDRDTPTLSALAFAFPRFGPLPSPRRDMRLPARAVRLVRQCPRVCASCYHRLACLHHGARSSAAWPGLG